MTDAPHVQRKWNPTCDYASHLDVFKRGCGTPAQFLLIAAVRRTDAQGRPVGHVVPILHGDVDAAGNLVKPYSTACLLACRSHVSELWKGWSVLIHKLAEREKGLGPVAIDINLHPKWKAWWEENNRAAGSGDLVRGLLSRPS